MILFGGRVEIATAICIVRSLYKTACEIRMRELSVSTTSCVASVLGGFANLTDDSPLSKTDSPRTGTKTTEVRTNDVGP